MDEDCEGIADSLWDIEYSALFTVDVIRVDDQIAKFFQFESIFCFD